MSLNKLRGSVAIVGVGQAGIGDATGFTAIEILADAARKAVIDAGMKMTDIDGLATCSSAASMWSLPVAEYLGLRPQFINSTMIGGSSFIAHIMPAMQALVSGQCNAVLVCYGSNQKTGTFSRTEMVKAFRLIDPQPYEHPYFPVQPVTSYALAAARHMYEFGTSRKQLAEVAVAARKWAQLNPEAYSREALSIDDVLHSRMISSPLTIRDCCLVTDGAGAFVMTRAPREKVFPKAPIYVLGNATAIWNRQISSMHDLTMTAASESGKKAFEMAGLTPADVDVVCLYDAFTINTILFLEDLGFCSKGEGGDFVDYGGIAPGGHLPVNTNGGGLSCVHPGMYGIFLVIEAVRQLRGECGDRQIKGAQIALAHGNGGTLSSQSTVLLGSEQAL